MGFKEVKVPKMSRTEIMRGRKGSSFVRGRVVEYFFKFRKLFRWTEKLEEEKAKSREFGHRMERERQLEVERESLKCVLIVIGSNK